METVIGIDLGTTNSCVAVVEGGQPVVIANRGGYKTTPSMVAITEAGKRLVGHIAKRQAVTNAEHTVFAAKRLIGRRWDSQQVQNAVTNCPYTIVKGPNTDVRIQLRGKVYSVPEVSAPIGPSALLTTGGRNTGPRRKRFAASRPAAFNSGVKSIRSLSITPLRE